MSKLFIPVPGAVIPATNGKGGYRMLLIEGRNPDGKVIARVPYNPQELDGGDKAIETLVGKAVTAGLNILFEWSLGTEDHQPELMGLVWDERLAAYPYLIAYLSDDDDENESIKRNLGTNRFGFDDLFAAFWRLSGICGQDEDLWDRDGKMLSIFFMDPLMRLLCPELEEEDFFALLYTGDYGDPYEESGTQADWEVLQRRTENANPSTVCDYFAARYGETDGIQAMRKHLDKFGEEASFDWFHFAFQDADIILDLDLNGDIWFELKGGGEPTAQEVDAVLKDMFS